MEQEWIEITEYLRIAREKSSTTRGDTKKAWENYVKVLERIIALDF